MKRKPGKPVITFKQAVESTPDIATGYQAGLSALGSYSNRVMVSDTTKLQGSIDIDACTTAKYPQDNRWDYAFAYQKEVFFIEVHSAITSEVRTVLRKLDWLKDWLVNQAPQINKLKAKSRNPFVWVQTNNFQIPKTSPQYLMAVQKGILPVKRLVLD